MPTKVAPVQSRVSFVKRSPPTKSKVSDSGIVRLPEHRPGLGALHGAVAGRNRERRQVDRLEPVDVGLTVVGADDPRPPERIVRGQPDLLREILNVVEREVVRGHVRRRVDVLALALGEVRVAADRGERRIADVPIDRQRYVVRPEAELRIDARRAVVDIAVIVGIAEQIHAGALVDAPGDDGRADGGGVARVACADVLQQGLLRL